MVQTPRLVVAHWPKAGQSWPPCRFALPGTDKMLSTVVSSFDLTDWVARVESLRLDFERWRSPEPARWDKVIDMQRQRAELATRLPVREASVVRRAGSSARWVAPPAGTRAFDAFDATTELQAVLILRLKTYRAEASSIGDGALSYMDSSRRERYYEDGQPAHIRRHADGWRIADPSDGSGMYTLRERG